jgi:hypothetical protein
VSHAVRRPSLGHHADAHAVGVELPECPAHVDAGQSIFRRSGPRLAGENAITPKQAERGPIQSDRNALQAPPLGRPNPVQNPHHKFEQATLADGAPIFLVDFVGADRADGSSLVRSALSADQMACDQDRFSIREVSSVTPKSEDLAL